MAKLYVAYGSNLNLAQMARRCPDAKVVGIGTLKNYQLTFRGVATIEPVDGAETPVGVWEITPRDELALDRYEGYPSYYRGNGNGRYAERSGRGNGVHNERRQAEYAVGILLQHNSRRIQGCRTRSEIPASGSRRYEKANESESIKTKSNACSKGELRLSFYLL